MPTYWEQQFRYVDTRATGKVHLKVSGSDGISTKWLTLTAEQWERVKSLLLEIEED